MANTVSTPSNEFGITFVPEEEVPEAPRQNTRNKALWKAVLMMLRQYPGQWAQVQEFDKPGSAGQLTSNINNNKNKSFPSNEWEARYTKTENSSILFMRYTGKKMTAAQAAEASDAQAQGAADSTEESA